MDACLRVLGLLLAFVAASARARAAEPGGPPPPRSEQRRRPIDPSEKGNAPGLHLRLTAGRTTYYLVNGGRSLRKQIDDFRRLEATGTAPSPGHLNHGDGDVRENLRRQLERPLHLFEPLEVDLTLEISNVTSRDVSFLTYGDDRTEVRFELTGPGVEVLRPRHLWTMEFRLPDPTELTPGQTEPIKLTRLAYGRRGVEEQAYWTVPGRYTLRAFFKTAIKPPAAGPSADQDGFETVTLTSNPVTIDVRSAPGPRK